MIDTIIEGDCLDILPTIPSESVDLVFADPPYNMRVEGSINRPEGGQFTSVNDEWDRFDSWADYDKFTEVWLWECRRILKDTGSIWCCGTYHNTFRVGKILMDLGYWILNDIVWAKPNPTPNFRGVRFCASHENLIWASKKEGAKYTFNYQELKKLNNGKQMGSVWIIPSCRGKERIKLDGEKFHTTQKPEELLSRIILATTKKDDLILDPFFGTGTTGYVAKFLNRHYIGIDKNKKYVEIAGYRIGSLL